MGRKKKVVNNSGSNVNVDEEMKVVFTNDEEIDENASATSKELKKEKNSTSIEIEEKKILEWAKEKNVLHVDSDNISPIISKEVNENINKIYQDMTKEHGNCVIELSDNSFRVRGIKTEMSSPVAEFQDLAVYDNKKKEIMVLQDDERTIGIPYTIANVGADRYWVINGRVYSGWSMWFGLQAIRAPEDYAKNVDLAYNVPFIWSGFQLKAQTSLGASFDITQGSEEEETPEETFTKEIFFSKLKINLQKLMKTSFHLDTYGNSYWHIRRDDNGFPDKITILQPERIKVFLDPQTTKVLYYIYLPPVLAGMTLTPYPNIRNNPNILSGPALTYPTPIIIDPHDIIHFKENAFSEFPYGISSCKAMIDPCSARMDINLIAPMIFKRYAKPLIHWRLDPSSPFQLAKGQIENYIEGMKSTLENMEPMSDPITTTRWSATMIGAAQGKTELLSILQDLDNQIFSCIGVPQSYFKSMNTGDRMIAEQDKTFMASMAQRQEMVGEQIEEKILRPIIDRYDKLLNMQLAEANEPLLPKRLFSQYPKLQWRETFKQDQVTTIQNTLALLQMGIIDHSRAARRVGENAPYMSDELKRQMDLKKVSEEMQIEQAKLQFMQTQLQELDTSAMIQAGGTANYQLQVQMAQAGLQQQAMEAQGESAPSGKDSGKTKEQKKGEKIEENARYRVTFKNKSGKKQVEVMKGSTLQDRKKGGLVIMNIEPISRGDTAVAESNKG